MPKVLILSGGQDTAGCGIALKRAFDREAPDWSARAVCRKETYLQYPTDILWPLTGGRRAGRVVEQLFAEADVVHVMQTTTVLRHFRGVVDKPILLQQLGTYYRENAAYADRTAREVGALLTIYGAELVDIAPPRTPLLPGAADVVALAELRRAEYRPTDRIRIAHAPTNRAIKSTDAFLAAFDRLAARYPVDLELIENTPHAECLRRKAGADIFFDEVILGYGINAVECWAMQIPVVAGLRDLAARDAFRRLWGPFPFVDATEATIYDHLERLVLSPGLRRKWGKRGHQFGRRYHADAVIVAQTIALYQRAAEMKGLSLAA